MVRSLSPLLSGVGIHHVIHHVHAVHLTHLTHHGLEILGVHHMHGVHHLTHHHWGHHLSRLDLLQSVESVLLDMIGDVELFGVLEES